MGVAVPEAKTWHVPFATLEALHLKQSMNGPLSVLRKGLGCGQPRRMLERLRSAAPQLRAAIEATEHITIASATSRVAHRALCSYVARETRRHRALAYGLARRVTAKNARRDQVLKAVARVLGSPTGIPIGNASVKVDTSLANLTATLKMLPPAEQELLRLHAAPRARTVVLTRAIAPRAAGVALLCEQCGIPVSRHSGKCAFSKNTHVVSFDDKNEAIECGHCGSVCTVVDLAKWNVATWSRTRLLCSMRACHECGNACHNPDWSRGKPLCLKCTPAPLTTSSAAFVCFCGKQRGVKHFVTNSTGGKIRVAVCPRHARVGKVSHSCLLGIEPWPKTSCRSTFAGAGAIVGAKSRLRRPTPWPSPSGPTFP